MNKNNRIPLSYEDYEKNKKQLLVREKKLFKLLDEVCFDIMMTGATNGDNRANLFERQYYEEEHRDNMTSNRFFRRLDNSKLMITKSKSIPELYAIYPKMKIFKNQEQYNLLSDEQKIKVEQQMYKQLAVIYARLANAVNKQKKDHETAYDEKNIYMLKFLEYVNKYNQMVPENHQIVYGIEEDAKYGYALLNASIPGYTRLSLHFGSRRNFYEIMKNVNNVLYSDGFLKPYDTFKNRKGKEMVNAENIFKTNQYPLPTFNVVNTGLINRDSFNGLDNYIAILREKTFEYSNGSINANGIDEYINIIDPTLNDREVFYIMERAGYGKGFLEKTNELLKKRQERVKEARKAGITIQQRYIQERLQNTKSDKEQISILENIFNDMNRIGNVELAQYCAEIKSIGGNEGVISKVVCSYYEKQKSEEEPNVGKFLNVSKFVSEEDSKIFSELFSEEFNKMDENQLLNFLWDYIFPDEFSKENFIKTLKYGNPSVQKVLIKMFKEQIEETEMPLKEREELLENLIYDKEMEQILEEAKKTSETNFDITDELLELATDSNPQDRDEAEKIEQRLLNRKKEI